MTTSGVDEARLLAAARRGDDDAYRLLVQPFRRELEVHCYRMLASVHDAEDAVQETLVRAWRGLARFEARSSLRTWLYTIATNTCLRLSEQRRRRALPVDLMEPAAHGETPGRPLVESVWVEPFAGETDVGYAAPDARYEQREAVELAFVAAVQHLPAQQRAALILRDVLGFSARETATLLSTTEPAANSLLQRARKTTEERLPPQSQQATLRTLGDDAVSDVVGRYMQAMESGDVDEVVSLLVAEPTWSMPPLGTWYGGADDVRAFLRDFPLTHEWRHAPVSANAQPALLCYMREPDGRFLLHAVDVLTLDARGRIAAVTAFLDPTVYPRFGAPLELVADAR
jgi:RNA polymerase sigma-70 factor, ECF subfamily